MAHTVDPTIKTRLLLRPVKSPLGTIRLAGINQGGFGVGRPPDPRRLLNCYGFTYIMNGTGQYADASTHATVGKGDLVVFFPGRPHQCCTRPDELWDELWFECEGPAFDLMRKTGMLNPKRPLHHTQDSDLWFRRFFQIIPPLHLREKTSPQVTVSRFVAVVSELLAGSETPADDTPAPVDDWLNAACEMLATHEGVNGMEPADVAKKLGFSYESFRKKFRSAVGFAPGRFHLDSRIDRAAALLHQGRHTIKEIAAQLQFCDEFYFSRCFKRRFGQSPRAFRRRVRGGA